jgi:hypothetical protein
MSAMTKSFHFVDSANGTVGGRHYDICHSDGDAVWSCDTSGPALNETIRFLDASGQTDITLVPTRRVMNRSFTLHEGGVDGPVIAALTTRGFGYEWKLSAPGGDERFRIVDPTGKLEASLRFLFEGFTDKYALVANGRVIGRISPQGRPETGERPRGMRGLLRRLIGLSDWTLTLEDAAVDPRQAVASVLLLIELQIRGRGGMS